MRPSDRFRKGSKLPICSHDRPGTGLGQYHRPGDHGPTADLAVTPITIGCILKFGVTSLAVELSKTRTPCRLRNGPQHEQREMNMKETRELNGAEVEVVAGGMTCDTALVVSNIYLTAATALLGLGQPAKAAYFAGKSGGVTEGAGCPK